MPSGLRWLISCPDRCLARRAAKLGLKSNREFLRNISIGAVGVCQVARLLHKGGFHIIELERYAMSNKIWANKNKRLRVPDLLCLKTGIRFESRAKSSLKVTMSHTKNKKKPERTWDYGLRDMDIVAFIRCWKQGDRWQPANRMNLFLAGEMRKVAHLAGGEKVKAASEGSELQLTWPSCVPQERGRVISVSRDQIRIKLDSGKESKCRLPRKKKVTDSDGCKQLVHFMLHPCVAVGDVVCGEDIIAAPMQNIVPPICPKVHQYDFLADLDNNERVTVYAAVKALGFLPEFSGQSRSRLLHIMNNHPDHYIRLEAASSLARLKISPGLEHIAQVATSTSEIELRMEAALILAEHETDEALKLLAKVASDIANPSELRAASAWGMAGYPRDIRNTPLLELVASDDDVTAVHAIVAASRLLSEDSLDYALDLIGADERRSAGIIRAITASQLNPVEKVVSRLGATEAEAVSRPWLLYLLASLGRKLCEPYISSQAPALLNELGFFWAFHKENWTNRLDVADQIDFLMDQFPR